MIIFIYKIGNLCISLVKISRKQILCRSNVEFVDNLYMARYKRWGNQNKKKKNEYDGVNEAKSLKA